MSRELNGKAITPRAKSIELLYHYAMGQNDEACYPYLDEARTLNANLKRELRATGHVNFWQVCTTPARIWNLHLKCNGR